MFRFLILIACVIQAYTIPCALIEHGIYEASDRMSTENHFQNTSTIYRDFSKTITVLYTAKDAEPLILHMRK